MKLEVQIIDDCLCVFEKLGWIVSVCEKANNRNFRYDLVLRHNDEIKGYIEVYSRDNLKEKTRGMDFILNSIKDTNLFLIVTNGYAYDLYISNEFFGCLSVPPAPEDIELLLGGANNE